MGIYLHELIHICRDDDGDDDDGEEDEEEGYNPESCTHLMNSNGVVKLLCNIIQDLEACLDELYACEPPTDPDDLADWEEKWAAADECLQALKDALCDVIETELNHWNSADGLKAANKCAENGELELEPDVGNGCCTIPPIDPPPEGGWTSEDPPLKSDCGSERE